MTLGGLLWPLFFFILGIWVLWVFTMVAIGSTGTTCRIDLKFFYLHYDPDSEGGKLNMGFGRLPAP